MKHCYNVHKDHWKNHCELSKIALSRARSFLSCLLTTCTEGASGYTFKRCNVLTKQLLRVMKLTGILLLTACLHVSANSIGQSVTLSVKNVSLEKVFTEIIRQSGTSIIYNNISIKKAKPVSIEVKNATAEEALDLCLKGQPFLYAKEDGLILIKPKPIPDLSQGFGDSFGSQLSPSLTAPPVTGIVRGPDGQPIVGANVIIKGTKRGTTTNANGSFSIEANQGEVIIISSIGFEERRINASENNIGVISLVASEAKLDEVQIIAYGTTTKRYNTSNIGVVKAADIARQPVSNPLLALQAQVPGLFISQTSGNTAGNVNVNIQGVNSFNPNGNNPLYVVDGVPYTPQFTEFSLLATNLVGSGGSTFNFINSADIESISILKDADATSIYGSRAANGAILITTKKGKAGKTKIDVNLRNGWGKANHKLDFLNTSQYLEMRKEAYLNAGQQVPTIADANESNADLTLWDQNRYTDWQKELVGGTAQFTDVQASVSGGSGKTQFLVGYAYNRQTTVYPNSLADVKGSVHFNLNHISADNRLTYTLTATYLKDKNQLNGTDLMDAATKLAPNAPSLYQPDGSLNWGLYSNGSNIYTFQNPLATAKNIYTGLTQNLLANNIIGFKVLNDLQIEANFGYNRLSADETQINPISALRPDAYSKVRSANFLTKSITTWNIEPQLRYHKDFKLGILEALIGTSFQQISTDVLSQAGYGYSNDAQLNNLAAATRVSVIAVDKPLYKYNAIFGRFNYRLNNKYIININARKDGSSRFGDENKFHSFYSIGGAWLFGEEDFAKQNAAWLSLGKLRLTYGSTGNDQITDYRYLSLLNIINVDAPYQGSIGLIQSGVANPFIQWEETRKINVGLDMGFMNDRLMLTINAYRNRSSNLLVTYQLPTIVGFAGVDRNFPATIQNTGFEFQLNATPVSSKDFVWNTSFNLSLQRNKLIAFPNLANSTYANTYSIGQPVNLIKLFRYAGVNSQTGLYEFFDAKGAKTSSPDYLNDRTAIIDRNPKYFGGLSNNISYKGVEFSFLIQFVKQVGANYKFGNLAGLVAINQPTSILNRWKAVDDISEVQKASTSFELFSPYFNVLSSDGYYSDASFLRLKNMSVSYALPGKWISNLKMSQAKISIQAQNLLTITNFVGSDPETKATGVLPPLRMFTAAFQFTF
jgi:TonB-dependent starch-binding outer membrane protein SusC